ncbi:MAG: sigma-70 family RNA polymerase sigma factor [Clostridia bacterium]|nr:sigma-70 family RNA polymerase sigma factor [Clostridia bacterium]
MNDPDIIKLYLERDESAVEQTKRKYGAYLSAIAGRILPDRRDAEEIVSDACLACWRSIPPNEPDDLASYAGRLCRNAAIDRVRRETRVRRGSGGYETALDELAELASGVSPEKELERAAFTALLNGFLGSLPGRSRRVFVQRYWYLLSVGEIAADNGMSEAAVKMRLSRTRAELKKLLIKEGMFYE